MKPKFELTPAGPVGSDCTAPYNVRLNREYTVAEFIEDALSSWDLGTWGNIRVIYDRAMSDRGPACNYRNGCLLSTIPAEWLAMKVISGVAVGGWSCMDYVIKVDNPYTRGMAYDKTVHEGWADRLILEPCDWTEGEWKTICKIFGMEKAERIVVSDYILETFGVKK